MSEPAPPAGRLANHNPAAGIILMMSAFGCFSVLDATAKYLVQTYDPALVTFARYALGSLLIVSVITGSGKLSDLKTKAAGLQVLRGLLLATATFSNFIAVQYLRLDQTAAIMFSNPLWVCALSPFLLGEHVGPRRWAAVLIGFFGVLIIIRPGLDGFHWAMLLSLLMAVSTALYQIVTRFVGGRDNATVSVFYATIVGAILAAPFGIHAMAPVTPVALSLMLLLGIAGYMGHFMLAQAHRLAPASLLAPYIYTQIVWMIIIGYLVFGDVPDIVTISGAFLVVAAGLYVFHRERKLKGQLEHG